MDNSTPNPPLKTCALCGALYPLTHFYRSHAKCKTCVLKRQSKYRDENREARRASNADYARRRRMADQVPFAKKPHPPRKVTPTEERFWQHVEKTDSCWIWTAGKVGGGYGAFSLTHSKRINAHRYSFLIHGGHIPEGYQLDHLCRNPSCVRPDHLEAVTPKVNSQRAKDATSYKRTHCRKGHMFTPDNTIMVMQRGKQVRRCKYCLYASKGRTHLLPEEPIDGCN